MDKKNVAAHIDQNNPSNIHDLEDHLRAVAQQAGKFAEPFGNGDWAYLAGLWHDLGKYHPEFQEYIYQDFEAHLEDHKTEIGKGRVNHSSAGALHAMTSLGERGRILAYLIAGHHTGLLDWYGTEDTGKRPLQNRLEEEKEKDRLNEIKNLILPPDLLDRPVPSSRPPSANSTDLSHSLWVRMLFSCLVDADFLDTENFMNPQKTRARLEEFSTLPELQEKLNGHFVAMKKEETDLNRIRADILSQCRAKANEREGFFSLSVPTGGGKTLSSMAFALDHAIKYKKSRIIYVIPYTSIIEQNAKVFKNILGEENVIEHHSNFDNGDENSRSRLATENWEAPIVVTTNVQFFESLFAARTSRVRKLHNIVNSVVILDEAQLLPVEFLVPTLKALEQLVCSYRTSVVFCTATQPSLTRSSSVKVLRKHGLQNVLEIINNPNALAEQLERVTIHPPADWEVPREWEDIAAEMQTHTRVLCIVNRRDDARDLYKIMKQNKDGLYHLSALMCPAHRSRVITEIKERLKDKTLPTRVISTQLIEAGVDVDFPVVYRSLAGLDSIAQAAGRCNREGTLGSKGGKVFIFIPPKPAPMGILRKSADAGKEILRAAYKNGGTSITLDMFTRFFDMFYENVNSLNAHNILDDLKSNEFKFEFQAAARKYKLIDETLGMPVVVLYGPEYKRIKEYIDMLIAKPYERWILRKLQRYTITIPKSWHARLLKSEDIEEVITGIFMQKNITSYDNNLGFIGDDINQCTPDNFIA